MHVSVDSITSARKRSPSLKMSGFEDRRSSALYETLARQEEFRDPSMRERPESLR